MTAPMPDPETYTELVPGVRIGPARLGASVDSMCEDHGFAELKPGVASSAEQTELVDRYEYVELDVEKATGLVDAISVERHCFFQGVDLIGMKPADVLVMFEQRRHKAEEVWEGAWQYSFEDLDMLWWVESGRLESITIYCGDHFDADAASNVSADG